MSYPKEKNKEYLAKRYAEQRREFLDFLGGRCVRCGSDEELEFDHIDWRTKSFTVARLYGLARLKTVYEELKKCQILCKSCHRDKTKQDMREQREENPRYLPTKHGARTGWMKTKCDCTPCAAAKRAWHDERNAVRRAEGGSKRGPYGKPSNHGERLHYRRGCRCDLCRAANTAYTRELQRKKIETT